ncbi:hypothetical protein JCM15765_38040 [Paradesulfitobacterium aromaticivorans]
MFFNNLLFAFFLVLTSQLEGLHTLNLEGVLYAVGGGLMGNVLGRTLNYQAVRRIGAARSISLSLSQTLVAFLFSVLLLGETVTLVSMLGSMRSESLTDERCLIFVLPV